jgi:methyl-accepting chemotaxis protein
MAKTSAKLAGSQTRRWSHLFSDRSISAKIFAGFACVLVITAAISLSSYLAFAWAAAGFNKFGSESRTADKVGGFDRNFQDLRWYVREFMLSGNPKALEQAKTSLTSLSDTLKSAQDAVKQPGQRQKLDQIQSNVEVFRKAFDQVSKVRLDQTKTQKEVLSPNGDKLRADMQELRDWAVKAGNNDVAFLAYEGMYLVMELRLNVVKFQERHDSQAAVAARQRFSDLELLITRIDPAMNAESRKIYDDLVSVLDKYDEAFTRINKSATDIERLAYTEMPKLSDQIAADSADVRNSALQEAVGAEKESEGLIGTVEKALILLALGGIALGVVLAWTIGRTISRPIIALVPELKKLAEGDFNIALHGLGRKDELGQISEAVSAMAGRIRHTIVDIKRSALEVNGASGEITTGTTDLSQRTEEQAASLEETTSAMEEISAAVKKNAENAEEANRSARAARDVADRGGSVVSKAVDAMAKIEESSRKISDIISVIDEIARQTNLLALNAAVEAARAGEAGRGFAVVASEVRSLAQRSSQAAKDIKELITNSNGQVQDGVDLVNRAGSALSEIVDSVKRVADLVSDIATASTEQSTGLEEINRALMQMDEVTQQNAALVEENAATAKSLEQQAKAMDDRVAFFKVGAMDGAEQAPAQAAAGAQARAQAPAPSRPAAREADAAKVEAAPVRKVARPAPVKRPPAARGPVGRMQAAVATAFQADPEWKEF